MPSVVLATTGDQTTAGVDRLRWFSIAPSLGDVESLVTQPITASTPPNEPNKASPTA